jgi:uncharacterized OB-fold protein
MTSQKKHALAIEGWFDVDETGRASLVASQCHSCKSYFFPKEAFFCRNPGCGGTSFSLVALSRTGKLWSYTSNCYKPPAPYVSSEPFTPYLVAAVELEKEKMVVLGQIVTGVSVSDLRVGMQMNLVADTLYEDETNTYLVWKWQPASPGARGARS